MDEQSLCELYTLADWYMVESLQVLCEKVLCNFNLKNVVWLLEQSYKRGIITVKTKGIDFLMWHFCKVIIMPEFVQLPQPLLTEIFAEVSRRGVVVNEVDSDHELEP